MLESECAMDTDRVTELLTEIRDLHQQLLESHQQALRNQQAAIEAQRTAIARGRKLQAALGVVIAGVFVVVIVLLRYVMQHFS